jgi:hypothetical protein
MGTIVTWLIVVVIGTFGGGGMSYVSGRFLCPELGLGVPSYGAWCVVAFIGCIVATFTGIVKGALKAVAD